MCTCCLWFGNNELLCSHGFNIGAHQKELVKLGTRKLAVSEVFWKVSRSFDKVVVHM